MSLKDRIAFITGVTSESNIEREENDANENFKFWFIKCGLSI